MKSDVVDISVVLHHQTDMAILVSDTGDRRKAVWLPKSAVEFECKGVVCIVTLPVQIAKDKGLI